MKSYGFDDVLVDPSNLRVTVAGEVRPLEPKSFRMLCFLIENRHRAVPKDEILQAVWSDVQVTDNVLTRAAAQIRKALDDDPKQPRYVETVPTVGYRFMAALREQTPLPSQPRPAPVRLTIAAVATVAAVAAGLLVWQNTERPAAAFSMRSSQFTSSEGLDIGAVFSAAGNLIAYASDRSGSFEIYVRSIDPSAHELQITSNGNENLFPTFSPDGQAVTFSSLKEPGVYRVSLLGGPVRRLTDFGTQPVWSPDGKWIVFASHTSSSMGTTDFYFPRDSTLWLIPAEGGEPRQITGNSRPLGGQRFPSWSPDSQEIRFVNNYARGCSMWTYRLPDGVMRELFRSYDNCYGSATFTRDGTAMFYVVSRLNGDIGIYRQRLNPNTLSAVGAPEALYQPSVGVPRDVSLSPDGKHLIYSAVIAKSRLMMLKMSGDTPRDDWPEELTHEVSYRFVMPNLSPDGKSLAYMQLPKSGLPRIWVKTLPDGEPAPVGPDSEAQFYPEFSADGLSVRYMARHRGQDTTALESIRLSDGTMRVLGSIPGAAYQPSFSPDGSEVVFNDDTAGDMQTWKLNLKTRARTRMTSAPLGAGYARYSHDGKRLFFQVRQQNGANQLTVMPSSGGPMEVIKDGGVNFSFGSSPDDSKVPYAGLVDGVWNIYWISVSTHEVRQLTHYNQSRIYVRYPVWSRTGDKIVYEFNEPRGNVYLADIR